MLFLRKKDDLWICSLWMSKRCLLYVNRCLKDVFCTLWMSKRLFCTSHSNYFISHPLQVFVKVYNIQLPKTIYWNTSKDVDTEDHWQDHHNMESSERERHDGDVLNLRMVYGLILFKLSVWLRLYVWWKVRSKFDIRLFTCSNILDVFS